MNRSRVITRIRYAFLSAVVTGLSVYAYTHNTREIVQVPVEFVPEPESWGVPVGVPAPLEVATKPAAVSIHKGCRISRFGTHPWRKTGRRAGEAPEPMGAEWEAATREALRLMELPAPAIDKAIAKFKAGTPDDWIDLSNSHGFARLSGQMYLPKFTTSYRHATTGERVLCLDSATNFSSDTRTETAMSYRVSHGDKVWHLALPLACDNVGEVMPAPAGWMPKAPRPDVAQWVVPHPAQARGAPLPGHGGYFAHPVVPGHGYAVNEVPEPGALVLVLAGLAGIAVVRRKGGKV